jgi:hypothetical protein
MTGIDAKTITCVVEDDNWLHLNYPHHSGGYTTGCLWSLELIAGTEDDARELLAHSSKTVNSYSETDAKISALEEENKRLREALNAMVHAVCGETGFANAVRVVSGTEYPWPALDLAEEKAIAALETKS